MINMKSEVTPIVKPEVVDLRSEDKRLVRTSNIEAAAKEVFGNSDQAKMWMAQDNSALGATPLSMLVSDAGAQIDPG
jgi:uncharacterized protein (DUF2384 family)